MNIPAGLQSNLVMNLDFTQGSLLDKSGNSNNAVATGNPQWVNTQKGKGVRVTNEYSSNSDKITAANSTSLNIGGTGSELTLVCFADFGDVANYDNFSRMFSKRDGGGTNYEMTVGSSAIYYRSGASASSLSQTINATYPCINMIATTHVTGEKNKVYVNGNYFGEGDTAIDLAQNDADLQIGNYFGTGGGMLKPIQQALIFNTELSSQQMSQLYDEFMRSRGIGTLGKRNFQLPENISGNEANLVGGWNLRNDGGKCRDVSVGSNDMDIIGTMQIKTPWGEPAQKFPGDVAASVETDASFSSTSYANATIAFLFKVGSTGSRYIADIGSSNDNLSIATSNRIPVLNDDINNANQTYSGSTALAEGEWYHGVVEVHSDGTKRFYVNNELEIDQATATNFTDGSDDDLVLGTRNGSNPWDGAIGLFQFYDKIFTDAGREKLYREQYVNKLLYRNTFEDAPVSLGATDGDLNDFIPSTGTWKISEDGTDKWLECVSAGIAYIPSEQAYGTWEFDLNKAASSNPSVIFTAETNAGISDSSQNGYTVIISSTETVSLREGVAGVVTTKLITASAYVAALTKYTIRVTRDYTGEFTVYLKGGAFTTWTLIDVSGGSGTNPVTDNTITTSKYTVIDLDAGDKISSIRTFQGIISPLTN